MSGVKEFNECGGFFNCEVEKNKKNGNCGRKVEMEQKNLNEINTNEITREAWDAYQEEYASIHVPDFEKWINGYFDLDCYEPMISLIGDVKGLKLLDTCCSSDAWQTYSWHNLGAKVTACDIAPKAIEIVRKNAETMGFDIECIVADMQKLEPIADGQFDIVFASYPIYVQDIFEACRNWHRVLKKGGKLLWSADHPILDCIEEDDTGVHITRDYNQPGTIWNESWGGTGASENYCGLPWVENIWRISDLLNAVCDAGFCIKKVHETYDGRFDSQNSGNEPQMKKLPADFFILAVKQ